jgi:ribosome recycling factor
MIASSFQGFIKALEEMKRLSAGRNNPVQLERNPVSAVERERALSRIAELNQNVSLEFWENWFAV